MRDIPLDNAKHEHFAQLVSNGESASQAYVLAGYSEKGAGQSANKLLKKSEVSSRIAYLRAKKEEVHEKAVTQRIERSQITKEWIEQKLVQVVEMGMQAEPVYDKDGNETGEYKQNLGAANKALELLGIDRGMFIKKSEVGKPGEFQDLNDSEIDRQLVETQRQIEAAGGSVH